MGTLSVRNVNRTVGTCRSREVTCRVGGLPDGTIDLTRLAADNFGLLPRVTLRLVGTRTTTSARAFRRPVIVRPDPSAHFVAQDNVIAGNVIG